jgi:hypothetical protein
MRGETTNTGPRSVHRDGFRSAQRTIPVTGTGPGLDTRASTVKVEIPSSGQLQHCTMSTSNLAESCQFFKNKHEIGGDLTMEIHHLPIVHDQFYIASSL